MTRRHRHQWMPLLWQDGATLVIRFDAVCYLCGKGKHGSVLGSMTWTR